MPFVTAEDILTHVGVKAPSDAETAWATKVAAAIESAIATRLNGAVILQPSGPYDELSLAALLAAGEAYKRREAPFGTTGYSDTDTAARLARDYLDPIAPLIERYGTGPGIS